MGLLGITVGLNNYWLLPLYVSPNENHWFHGYTTALVKYAMIAVDIRYFPMVEPMDATGTEQIRAATPEMCSSL
jgi:hypothetical protein